MYIPQKGFNLPSFEKNSMFLKNRWVFTFRFHFFVLAVLLLAVEIWIALFVHDRIVRPYIGDLLVVILIYCLVRSFLKTPVLSTALAVLIFSYLVELLQYFHFINMIGLQDSNFANIIIGNSFGWLDIVAYTAGILLVIFLEYSAAFLSRKP